MTQNKSIQTIRLGLIDYATAFSIQESYYNTILDIKKQNFSLNKETQQSTPNYLLFCEHLPVYTFGRGSTKDQLLVDHITLTQQSIALCDANRGGAITYHGPGQLVVYPIIDLENFFTDIYRYLRFLEQVVISVLDTFQIRSTVIPGLTGVWIPKNNENQLEDRKICVIGIKVSKWITMHGLALNVYNDLMPFMQIKPCGLSKPVTSMQQELKQTLSMPMVEKVLQEIFTQTIVEV